MSEAERKALERLLKVQAPIVKRTPIPPEEEQAELEAMQRAAERRGR